MKVERIDLSEHFAALRKIASTAVLEVYARENSQEYSPYRLLPAMLICPGGGYSFTCDREAEPIALEFLSSGFQCFVLRYTCAPARFPLQLAEAAAAMMYIKKNCGEYHIDSSQVAVMGFSAGGHVAASLSTLWDHPTVLTALQMHDGALLRPDAACLCYPVITSGKYSHAGSFVNLLGENASQELMSLLSLENAVRPDMPPVFLWHTFNDNVVPVENSFLFAMALREKNIPCEMHLFSDGVHGLSLATPLSSHYDGTVCTGPVNPNASRWVALCKHWLHETLPEKE